MKVIAGCVIQKHDKILMIQEGKKEVYGKWNFPAGHVEEFETIKEAAIRETWEETVKLTGVLPIACVDLPQETHVLIRFTAEILEETISFD